MSKNNIKTASIELSKCVPDVIDDLSLVDMQVCFQNTLEELVPDVATKRGKKSGGGGGGKRAPSDWNLAVKDCFANGKGMKQCSVEWKAKSPSEKAAVVAKYK